MLDRPALALINHLLEREAWARTRLIPFAGKRILFQLPPLPAWHAEITLEGRLTHAADGADATVAATVGRKPADWRIETAADSENIGGKAGGKSSGKAGETAGESAAATALPSLAAELRFLCDHLRWDAEEDLARLLGDIPARRIAAAGAALTSWQRDAIARLGTAGTDYLVDERAIAVRAIEVQALAQDIQALEERLAALEQRAQRVG